jgi:RNA polymerase sigma-70 factor (family 1)
MKEELDSNSLLAFSQGENSGFNAVYKQFYPEIRYFTYKLTSNKQEAEDITITTFLKLFRSHEHFKTAINIRAFLYITARNSCLDYLRTIKRRKTYARDFSDMNIGESAFETYNEGFEIYNGQAVMLTEIYNAVEKLPEQCRRVFKMLFYEEMQTSDIASLLHITPETVRSQKRRALELLRLHLMQNGINLGLTG